MTGSTNCIMSLVINRSKGKFLEMIHDLSHEIKWYWWYHVWEEFTGEIARVRGVGGPRRRSTT